MKKYYLLLLTNENDNGASLVSLLNNAGLGQMLLGRGGDLQTNLWLITKVRKEKNEVIKSLKELPAIKKVRIIEFNDPVAPDVIPKARFLVESMGFDTTLIKDEEWQLYLQANLERKFLYFFDLEDEKPYDRRPKIFLRPISESPNFDPKWMEEQVADPWTDEDETKVFSLSDFKIEEVSFTVELDDDEENDEQGGMPSRQSTE